MPAVWGVLSIGSFVILCHLNGNIKKWRSGVFYSPLATSASAEFKSFPTEQRTFSYPDTLEFNYFDVDNLPRYLQAHADIIYSTAQSLQNQLGFQVDNARLLSNNKNILYF